MVKPLWMWVLFLVVVGILLVWDLGFMHRKGHVIGIRESLWTSGFYILIGFLFGGWVWYSIGVQGFKEYITGFLIEKSLSLDNIFVISLVFSFFKIPLKYQHRVLFWGILGVIFFRAILIALGAKLVANFAWILYVFSIFLVFAGVKLLFGRNYSVENATWAHFIRKSLRITNECDDEKFFVTKPNLQTRKMQIWCTPLFAALISIEFMDLIFAIDSIPAIFTITTDPYIVYTSNIFAILGLRALFFALAAMLHRFTYLKYSLALLLIFIGSKIFIADAFHLEKFPTSISLAIAIVLLSSGVFFSFCKQSRK